MIIMDLIYFLIEEEELEKQKEDLVLKEMRSGQELMIFLGLWIKKEGLNMEREREV